MVLLREDEVMPQEADEMAMPETADNETCKEVFTVEMFPKTENDFWKEEGSMRFR